MFPGSALVLSAVVAYDRQAHVFGVGEVREITDAALRYVARDHDLRGFVPGKGWAHSVAHTADLLAMLAEHPGVGASDLGRMLYAISAKVLAPTPYPYVDREEFRPVTQREGATPVTRQLLEEGRELTHPHLAFPPELAQKTLQEDRERR